MYYWARYLVSDLLSRFLTYKCLLIKNSHIYYDRVFGTSENVEKYSSEIVVSEGILHVTFHYSKMAFSVVDNYS